jgi:hypothetical protein
MPRFAIRLQDGRYLRKQANPTWRKEERRRIVDTLEEATLWHKEGHAKNALLAAVENKHLPKSVVAYIVEVRLVESDCELGPLKVKSDRYRNSIVQGTES